MPTSIHLQIGPEQCDVTLPGQPPRQISLPLGSTSLPLRRTPPTPYELELAIAEIEDVLMYENPPLPHGAALHLTSQQPLAAILGAHELQRADIERAFGQLAAQLEGDPLAAGHFPLEPAFVAELLILREWMHHLDAPEVTLQQV